MQETLVQSLIWEDSTCCGAIKLMCHNYWEGTGSPLQHSCLESPTDGGTCWAAVHGVAKRWTWLSNFIFTFPFHALEKEMATHSGVLAWRIPGTAEPGGLTSTGSHRVGHDRSALEAAAATTTTEPVLHSPGAATTEPMWWDYWSPRHPRAHAAQEKPLQWEASTLPLESSSCSLQLEKKVCSNEDSAQPKIR